MLKDVKYNESQGKFGNVSGNEYTITAYTWTKQMEPIGMDMKKSYAELNISADKCVDIDEGPIGLFFEDLNYNCDGGLYAEQIEENRSFKLQIVTGDGNIVDAVTREPGYAWTSGNGTVNYLTDLLLNDKNTYYAQLSGITSGASLINKAYEGVYVEQGKIIASLFGLKKAYTLVTFLSVFQKGEKQATKVHWHSNLIHKEMTVGQSILYHYRQTVQSVKLITQLV